MNSLGGLRCKPPILLQDTVPVKLTPFLYWAEDLSRILEIATPIKLGAYVKISSLSLSSSRLLLPV